ncbi:hypothetical protein HMPREF9370_1972 [Neisseria wadsworthii 9715]|uniref:Uncharacterized protein n=1 Tax=Neisseria wadsworthii 9715 TaxID=1030841 RepID=G4CSB2_9NEIS|nr:hypothetical protein HMPREF9370_1972 [Neisseria wadsworthii 9715]
MGAGINTRFFRQASTLFQCLSETILNPDLTNGEFCNERYY